MDVCLSSPLACLLFDSITCHRFSHTQLYVVQFIQGCRSFWKWETALPQIIHDDRYKALKTLEDRKKVFKEFQEELIKKEKDLEYEKETKAKNNFLQLLKECKLIRDSRTRYKDVQSVLEKDPRYNAVEVSGLSPLFWSG